MVGYLFFQLKAILGVVSMVSVELTVFVSVFFRGLVLIFSSHLISVSTWAMGALRGGASILDGEVVYEGVCHLFVALNPDLTSCFSPRHGSLFS